jgi:hypothetical protein
MSVDQVLDTFNVNLKVQFCKCVAVFLVVLTRVLLCSHTLRQPVTDTKVTGTWQVSSSAHGKSHLRLDLCMSADMFHSITTIR